MTHTFERFYDIDGLVSVEGVLVTIGADIETYPSEGGPASTETSMTDVHLIMIKVGGLVLGPTLAHMMFGEDAFQRILNTVELDDFS